MLKERAESHQEDEKQEPDWVGYFYSITDEHIQPEELEELLLQEHPVMPGEREAFSHLNKENLGHKPKVMLDESGFHVVPAKEQ